MSGTLACARPGVFRAAGGHSGSGVTNPTKCDPIRYLGSGGLQENVTQTTQTDQFAKWNGCTIETFAKAPTGGARVLRLPGRFGGQSGSLVQL
jgi:hypothetical protein